MNAVPDKVEGDTSKEPGASRREKLEARGIDIGMPPVDAPYLIGYLWDVGPTKSSGMGASPIEQPDIESFQRNMGIELQPWEVRVLIRMSREYVSESSKATRSDYPAPWMPERYDTHRADVAKSLRAAMRQNASI